MTIHTIPASPRLCHRCDGPIPPSQRGTLSTGEILDGPPGTTWQVAAIAYRGDGGRKWESTVCAACGRFIQSLAVEYTLHLASGVMPDGATAVVARGYDLVDFHRPGLPRTDPA